MAARKKTTAKRTAPAPAKKATPKAAPAKKVLAAKPAAVAKPAPKKAAPKKEAPAASGVEALAKRIVKATTGGEIGAHDFEEFYAPDCVSYESRGEPAVGFEGLAEKGKLWSAMQKRSTWTALNVVTKGNTILIEWSAEVELRDGRTVTLREVAVHNTRGGKIVEERYYYDPVVFDAPVEEVPAEVPAPRPARRAAPPPPVETHGTPSVDPIDL